MRLKNAPLTHVLAQVVFSPVLNIRERRADLQKAFIGLGLPALEESSRQDITFVSGKQPEVVISPRWDFTNRELTEDLALTETALVLSTSQYQTSELFFERLRACVSTVHSIVQPTLVTRIGIRYVDLVQPGPDENFGDYVHPGMLGFPLRPDGAAQRNQTVTITTFVTEAGTMSVRSLLLPPGQLTPPDLAPTVLAYENRFESTRPGLALDFDHFRVLREDFDVSSIMDCVLGLKKNMTSAFEQATTDYARERWGPRISGAHGA